MPWLLIMAEQSNDVLLLKCPTLWVLLNLRVPCDVFSCFFELMVFLQIDKCFHSLDTLFEASG